MHNILETILQKKQHEVSNLLGNGEENFRRIFLKDKLAVIAEFKRRSPSKGDFSDLADPAPLLEAYRKGGAAAFSILTDSNFAGSISDLTCAAKLGVPVLRKEFIIDPIQLSESKIYGADAVLAIAAILPDKLAMILAKAKELKLAVIVEVHTKRELELALYHDAEIIGVNNRNLNSFEVDLEISTSLIKYIPDHIIRIAESGIQEPQDARDLFHLGFNGVLIGESLMKSPDPARFIEACHDA